MMEPMPGDPPPKMVDRDPPEPPEERRALVTKRLDAIKAAERHFEPDFKRMRQDMDLCRWGDVDEDEDAYRANITARHVKQTVAALYAKNPRLTARRRKRLEFKVWDGDPMKLQQAAMAQQMAMDPVAMADPNAQAMVMQASALMTDVQEAQQRMQLYDRIAKTLQIVAEYYVSEQSPTFKKQMKQLVRRTAICGVGYLKPGFQRIQSRAPEIETRLADAKQRLAKLEQMAADAHDDEMQPDSAEAEDLRLMIGQLESEPVVDLREGLIFEFPKATHVIPDIATRQLDGWVGCTRLREKFLLTPDQVQQTYGVDVASSYSAYTPGGKQSNITEKGKTDLVCVYEEYDRETGLKYCMADGYPDFLREPYPPEVDIEGFFPIFALAFNTEEHEDKVFPWSDVHRLKPIQREYNRLREGLRQHRWNARPRSVTSGGAFEEGEKESITNAPAHSIIDLKSAQPGEDIAKRVMAFPVAPLDPNMYQDGPVFQDMLRVTNSQEANVGGTSDATATESSIAETSRVSGLSSNADDLNDFLTDVMRAAGQICLLNVSAETATRIAGPGAVWPELDRKTVMEEIELGIVASSSGRPNRAQELANMERATPLLMQLPGIRPDWLARRVMDLLDENISLEEAFLAGLPSITAANAVAGKPQPGTGNPETDPNQQGPDGEDNAPAPEEPPPGGQPAFPVVNYDATGSRVAQPGVAQ